MSNFAKSFFFVAFKYAAADTNYSCIPWDVPSVRPDVQPCPGIIAKEFKQQFLRENR